MLIQNYSYINCVLGHQFGGLTTPLIYSKPATMRNYYSRCDIDSVALCAQRKKDSFPTGTNPPYSYILGDKGALLSATTQLNGIGSQTSGLSMGKACSASLTGTGTISAANLSLIVSLASSLSGSGTITVANLVGVVSLASSITSTGSLTAGLSLISFLNSTLNGTSSITAGLRGTLSMSASIYVNQSEADVQQLVDGVWNALTVDYNNAGTMGEAMAAAGSAGDPWLTLLPGSYLPGTAGDIIGNMSSSAIAVAVWDELKTGHNTPDTYGKIIKDLQVLIDELHKVQGLNALYPTTTTQTNLTVDTINIDITGDGETTTTFTRND